MSLSLKLLRHSAVHFEKLIAFVSVLMLFIGIHKGTGAFDHVVHVKDKFALTLDILQSSLRLPTIDHALLQIMIDIGGSSLQYS